jgi:hypothetical protein
MMETRAKSGRTRPRFSLAALKAAATPNARGYVKDSTLDAPPTKVAKIEIIFTVPYSIASAVGVAAPRGNRSRTLAPHLNLVKIGG